MSISAYPLCWPAGWARTEPGLRRGAKFNRRDHGAMYARKRDLTIADGVTRVLNELQAMGVHQDDIIISTNVETRLDGMPRSNRPEPYDPGVAVYWIDPWLSDPAKRNRVMAIDRYDRTADNLAAVAATLNAMRAIERHGGSRILERAFTGFTALPAPGGTTSPWREILGDDIRTAADLEARYRRLRSQAHPDRNGGSSERFHAVQRAYELAAMELQGVTA